VVTAQDLFNGTTETINNFIYLSLGEATLNTTNISGTGTLTALMNASVLLPGRTFPSTVPTSLALGMAEIDMSGLAQVLELGTLLCQLERIRMTVPKTGSLCKKGLPSDLR